MHIFILRYTPSDMKEFVLFWKDFYSEGKYPEGDYETRLRKRSQLKKEDIEFLLEWKNGGPLSQKKKVILNKCIKNIDKLNGFRELNNTTQDDFDDFSNFISDNITAGFIWKIFIIHVTRPNDYPMIDQHAFRAFEYIMNKRIVDKSSIDIISYFKYRNFLMETVKATMLDFRIIDKALFAFGKCLKEYKFPLNKIKF